MHAQPTGVIYGLHAGDGRVRYVGKTRQTPDARLRGHVRQAKVNDYHVSRWIRSIGGRPRLVILERCSVGSLDAAERAWIAYLRRMGCALTNGTDGGDGGSGHVKSPEARARISASMIGNQRGKGHVPTAEKRAKIAAALRGKPRSPEVRAKLSAALKGKPLRHPEACPCAVCDPKPHTAETRAKIGAASRGNQYARKKVAV